MGVGIESLFTTALGLVAPWEVAKVELDTARRRIDFSLRCTCPRRSKSEPPCRPNIEPGVEADLERVGCG